MPVKWATPAWGSWKLPASRKRKPRRVAKASAVRPGSADIRCREVRNEGPRLSGVVPHRQSSAFSQNGQNVTRTDVHSGQTRSYHFRMEARSDPILRPLVSAFPGKEVLAQDRSRFNGGRHRLLPANTESEQRGQAFSTRKLSTHAPGRHAAEEVAAHETVAAPAEHVQPRVPCHDQARLVAVMCRQERSTRFASVPGRRPSRLRKLAALS